MSPTLVIRPFQTPARGVAQVADVNEVVPIKRAYDFSYAIQAEQFLNKQGWKP